MLPRKEVGSESVEEEREERESSLLSSPVSVDSPEVLSEWEVCHVISERGRSEDYVVVQTVPSSPSQESVQETKLGMEREEMGKMKEEENERTNGSE